MFKKLSIIVLILFAFACEPDHAIAPADHHKPETTPATISGSHPVFGRSSPTTRMSLSGPAAGIQGRRESSASEQTAGIPFEANAGAIWKNPSTGATHVYALQLPSSNGPVLEADLGAGWDNTTALTMDATSFYAVHDNNIYKVDKTKFDTWKLVVPSNGKLIRFIVGDQDFRLGCFFVRDNLVYYYNATENFVTPLLKHPTINNLNWATSIAGFRNGVGDFYLYLNFDHGPSSPDTEMWRLTITKTFSQSWSKCKDYRNLLFAQSMVADPEQYRLYESGVPFSNSHTFNVNILSPNTGVNFIISNFFIVIDQPWPKEDIEEPMFAPGELAVNNSWLWMSGNYNQSTAHSLLKITTLGSHTGEVQAEYTGWEGTMKFCAYPQLHFN